VLTAVGFSRVVRRLLREVQREARALGVPSGSGPLTVAVVAGTKTRITALERLLAQPGIVVVGGALDPASAEQLVRDYTPQAVLLDLDLWNGGLEAIERIMATRATPLVVIGAAADHPEAAIAAGAVDVIGGLDVPPGSPEYAATVLRHLRVASRVRVITHPRGRLRGRVPAPSLHGPDPEPTTSDPSSPAARGSVFGPDRSGSSRPGDTATRVAAQRRGARPAGDQRSDSGPKTVPIVAIGASTGGPPALATILAEFPVDLPAAVVVVQHMAEGFVEGLARWLDGVCLLPVVVAVDGERLRAGQVYLAPANQNLVVRPGLRVGLEDPPPGQYHVPGVDVTFQSIARQNGADCVGVLLTGMGRDGAAGLRALRDAGSFTVGQDESTSVVWGMPAAAAQLDAVDRELPLPAIASAVVAAILEVAAGADDTSEPAAVGGRSR
jgi:two-component system chemotaxis response regulator CheB